MSATIYDYAMSASIVVPPDQWVLNGQSDENPYLAAYHVWLTTGMLTDLAACVAHVDGDNLLADTVTPFTGAPSLIGLYLNANTDPAAVGARLQTENNDLKLQVYTTGPTTVQHDWLWKDDGVLDITSTKQVKGFRAGLDATSEFRYGYGPSTSYPTFRYEFSPAGGGWTSSAAFATAAGSIGDGTAPRTSINGPVSPATVKFRTPVRIAGFDTARGTATTAATITGMYVKDLCIVGTPTSTSVRLVSKELSSGALLTVFEVTSTSTTPADFSDTTPAGGTSGVLAYGLRDYYLEWDCVDASSANGAEVFRVYLDIEKRTVE